MVHLPNPAVSIGILIHRMSFYAVNTVCFIYCFPCIIFIFALFVIHEEGFLLQHRCCSVYFLTVEYACLVLIRYLPILISAITKQMFLFVLLFIFIIFNYSFLLLIFIALQIYTFVHFHY